MRKMTSIIAVALIMILTAVLVSGCLTRIDLNDFTVPEMVVNYDGDWHFYKKRGVRPADYVLATEIMEAVVTDDEIGREGDYYIVEEDGRSDIMSSEEFKAAYKKLRRLRLPEKSEEYGEFE